MIACVFQGLVFSLMLSFHSTTISDFYASFHFIFFAFSARYSQDDEKDAF
jgi:hypothetical protein